MSILGFKGNNHPQQTGARGARDDINDRGTTPELLAEVIELGYGPFTLDVAAADHNAKCARYFTLTDDGLEQSWAGETVWCNPPYSDIHPWVAKALIECAHPGTTVTLLLPANRTEQAWWQDLIEPFRDRPGNRPGITTHFLRGRRRFIRHDAGFDSVQPNDRPPFGLVVVHIGSAA